MKMQSRIKDIAVHGHGILKWRWLIFVLLVMGYTFLELAEHPIVSNQISKDMLLEIVLFALPLGLAIFLSEILLGVVAEKDRAVNLLDEKNRLIRQLSEAEEWEDLVTQIAQYPASLAVVDRSWLQIYNDENTALTIEASWTPQEGTLFHPTSFNPPLECQSCRVHTSTVTPCLKPCDYIVQNASPPEARGYCLPLYYGSSLNATLCFALAKEQAISEEQSMVLNGNSTEIASALETAREQKARRQSDLANAARAERLLIARDLHDTLGQNLGYLHLKLDQFTRENGPQDVGQLKPELEQMRILADESYELVRGALAILHQDDDIRLKLCELIEVHGRMVANRAGLDFSLTCQGDSRLLPLQIVRQVYFAVKEALYNIERHAGKCRVKVVIDWGENDLTITIDDEGQGFDQNSVQKSRHFGLDIMQERLQACNGRLSVKSAPESGTQVSMWLPTTCD